jgi:hypothetical protein
MPRSLSLGLSVPLKKQFSISLISPSYQRQLEPIMNAVARYLSCAAALTFNLSASVVVA